jgi:translation initiation factor IF-2
MSNNSTQKTPKQPVIAIVGHVDHGKSTLLDYIHKTNVVEGEAGGITQKISAYVANHKGRKLTFLDTPGHAAFQNMRERGVELADIAVLIVSAEDGVKEQTKQAHATIEKIKIPYIVAITKIDKPAADLEKTKASLIENGIYLKNHNNDITYVTISSKTGENVDELLDNLVLLADISELSYDPNAEASGRILESFVDPKRGISATLILSDGTLPSSGAVLAGTSICPIRIIEDFNGKTIKNPVAGTPVKITGFDTIPATGSIFISSKDKKNLEKIKNEELDSQKKIVLDPRVYRNAKVVVPVIIKSSSQGALEAVKSELKKSETDDIKIKIVGEGVGNISEGDIIKASADPETVILGFDVNLESAARDQAERFKITPRVYDIIYKLTEDFEKIVDDKIPFEEIEKVVGKLRVLKTFGVNKDIRVIGGKVEQGLIHIGNVVKVIRRDYEIGKGRITNLQQMKMKSTEVTEGNECGLEVETKSEIIPGDTLVVVEIEKKKLL